MLLTLLVTGLLCLCSLGFVLIIPYFARTKLLMKFLPQDIRDAARDHRDPPPARLAVGYFMFLAMAVMFVGSYVFLGADGLRNGYGFWKLFGRYLFVLYGYKLFDILVQDQYIVITKQYFVKFYPETKDCRSWQDRSFNTKNQMIRLIIFPFTAALLAGITLLAGAGLSH